MEEKGFKRFLSSLPFEQGYYLKECKERCSDEINIFTTIIDMQREDFRSPDLGSVTPLHTFILSISSLSSGFKLNSLFKKEKKKPHWPYILCLLLFFVQLPLCFPLFSFPLSHLLEPNF